MATFKKTLKDNKIDEGTLKHYLKAAFRCGLLSVNQLQTRFIVELEDKEMDAKTDSMFEAWYQYFLTVNNNEEEE